MDTRTPCVFVVDDELVIARTLTIILRQHGFDAKYFTDPTEALSASRTAEPRLLISDVMMPMLNGVDLAIAILQIHPQCKILLLSGQPRALDFLLTARENGYPFRVLEKPIHPNDLLRHIREQDPILASVDSRDNAAINLMDHLGRQFSETQTE